MRRELAIALRAQIAWIVAAVGALLVGHGFVLAMDLFSSASRSALANALQSREMDPLLGIVRPTLGGVDSAIALLVPIVATRGLALEKERGGFGALCLQVGSPSRVLLRKAAAAACAASLLLVPPLVLLGVYSALGGHVDAVETAVALLGEVLHLGLIVATSIAAAAWASTFAQAATMAILVSLGSWAIEASEGFAALAWLGRVEAWSIGHHVTPLQHGSIAIGPILWLLVAIATALGIALVGVRFDVRFDQGTRRRLLCAAPIVVVGFAALYGAAHVRRAYDWTEERRASLPPAVVESLRRAPAIALEVHLDRDDSRRRQLEGDVLTKLRLARPDATVTFPLDEREGVAQGAREPGYGLIVVHVGAATRETTSTSRRELMTLVLEAAGSDPVDWTMPRYPGFPAVVEGGSRRLVLVLAYAVLPLAFFAIGIALTRKRIAR